jgi:hypothetical protein
MALSVGEESRKLALTNTISLTWHYNDMIPVNHASEKRHLTQNADPVEDILSIARLKDNLGKQVVVE